MKTLGRLQRVFPGPGLELNPATFKEPGFHLSVQTTTSEAKSRFSVF